MMKEMRWNDWLNLLCWAGLIVVFICTTWWMTLLFWGFEWMTWVAWLWYERKYHPEQLNAWIRDETKRKLEKMK